MSDEKHIEIGIDFGTAIAIAVWILLSFSLVSLVANGVLDRIKAIIEASK